MTIKGIPFDAPLYETGAEERFYYRNVEAVMAIFTTSSKVIAMLPDGLVPTTDPPLAAVWVGKYPFSTVGPYLEAFSAIQVRDNAGDLGLYVPYIYVTNDAAMAAGREVVGAPKKLATVEFKSELDVIQGTVERPLGKRLITLTVKPTGHLDSALETMLLPRPQYLYSIRHLPGIVGSEPITQVVKWSSDMRMHLDAFGEEVIFSGPGSLTYDSPSTIDPVHNLPVEEMVAGVYVECDFKLAVEGIFSAKPVVAEKEAVLVG